MLLIRELMQLNAEEMLKLGLIYCFQLQYFESLAKHKINTMVSDKK
jgi:hypothetical protein